MLPKMLLLGGHALLLALLLGGQKFFLNISVFNSLFLDKIEVSIAGTIKSNHGGHKMSKCSKCGKDSEARRLTDGFCFTCLKVMAKTVANGPAPNFLNAKALTRLPQKLEIGPDDSLSMAGMKR